MVSARQLGFIQATSTSTCRTNQYPQRRLIRPLGSYTYNQAKKFTILDEEIRRFDSLLEEIQEQIPDQFEVYERIVNVRDALYRLKAQLRGCEITQFEPSGSSSWFDDRMMRLDDWFNSSTDDIIDDDEDEQGGA